MSTIYFYFDDLIQVAQPQPVLGCSRPGQGHCFESCRRALHSYYVGWARDVHDGAKGWHEGLQALRLSGYAVSGLGLRVTSATSAY